jgi:hypothetical protein
MIYKVEEKIKIKYNSFHKKMKTNFDFDVVLYNKNKEERFYLVNRNNVINIPEIDNNFVKLLSELEEINYPLKVKTNTKRVFIDIEDFDNWLKEWQIKASKISEKYNNEENIKDIVDNYYQIIKNKDVFIKNKFKEPFWNLFFYDFNSKSFDWHINTIGTMNCQGQNKSLKTGPGKETWKFESFQQLSEPIIEKLKQTTTTDKTDWNSQKAELTVEFYVDYVEQSTRLKKAFFSLTIDNVISYDEETTITQID